jgi:PKD repeat protein
LEAVSVFQEETEMTSESRAAVLFAGLTLGALAPLFAAGTPAAPVPSDRWATQPTLQPAAILGDSTRFEGHTEPVRGNVREYHDVDVENGFLFAATGQGMAIYDLQANPLPALPIAYIFGYFDGSGAFPVWQHSDKDWYIKELDAPAGFDGVVALGMEEQGFGVVNTAIKGAPLVAYQGALDVTKVYAFTSGTTHFAYALSGGRLHRFNLSAALGMTKCVETPPAVSCPGVYLGEVAGFGTGNVDIQGMGSFAVTSRSGDTGGVRIFNIADPAAPALRLEIPGAAQTAVLWPQGSSWFLARLTQAGQMTIHNVSCITGGACAAPPPIVTLAPTPLQLYLKLSLDGGRPYIYAGNDDLGTCLPQREYLYDLSNPAAPVELTPKVHPAGYWGWYYMNCPTGFNLIGPRRAKVFNGILYRAAYNLLDAHRIQTGPVPARVDAVTASPASPKVCQPVTFTAANAVGTPPLAFAWTLESGTPPTIPVPGVGSTTGTLVWTTTATTLPGTYKATVMVSNAHGTDSKNTTVTLSSLPPLPAAGSFTPTVDPFTGSSVPFHVAVGGATAWNWDFDGDGVFNEADWTSDPQAGPNPTFTYSTPGTRQVRVKVRNCVSPAGVASAAVAVNIAGGKIVINGPDFGQPGQALQFSGVGVDGCSAPADSGWTWTAPGGAISGQPAGMVTITWSTLGNKTVTAKNAACPGITGSRPVRINPKLEACFSSSPPLKLARQPVTFDGSCSVGNPDNYLWDFGDHTILGSGKTPSHTYAAPGKYQVSLTVTRSGGDCPPAPFCESSRSDLVDVLPDKIALVAKFVASAEEVFAGQPVTFTDQSEGTPTSWSWDFGDGATATGSSASHVFVKAGLLEVGLTVGRDGETAFASKTIKVIQPASAVVVPWVARSRGGTGTVVQTSDLYVHNPGKAPMTVTLEFRRRGLPETSPPQAVRTVAPGATLYAADCVKNLFGRDENLSGFVLATPTAGSPQPVVTSFQTSGTAATAYGLAVQGIPLAPPVPGVPGLHLVGLNDGNRRTAFFGLTNPNDAPATYRLRFFDKAGLPIGGGSADLTVSRFGQRQFQLADIRSQFGVKDKEDYRVAIESTAAGLFPFGVNVWSSTGDPSLSAGGPRTAARLFVIGASNRPGADGTAWKTDLVLANPTAQAVPVKLTFVAVGVTSTPTAASSVSLAPGGTQRLADVLDKQWSVKSSVGVITIEPGPGGALPSALGESYRSPLLGGRRYGHALPVLAEEDAAGVGQSQTLAGLRQNSNSKATVWVLNPGPDLGEYDVIYRGLDGAELGRIAVRLGGGRARQLSPPQHPLPEAGTPDGFTVEVRVRGGKVLAGAQVVNAATGDSAYLAGTTSVEGRD